MFAKIVLLFCAQALFVQSALCRCPAGYTKADAEAYGVRCPLGYGESRGYYGLGAGCGYGGPAIDFSPTSGGSLPVSSSSAIAPYGLSVASENVYEGILAAAGELPFVGTVGVEGVLPTAGAGAVHHGCGSGINTMVSDNSGFGYAGAYGPGYTGAYGLGLGAPGLGYRAGWAGKGCGCGCGRL